MVEFLVRISKRRGLDLGGSSKKKGVEKGGHPNGRGNHRRVWKGV